MFDCQSVFLCRCKHRNRLSENSSKALSSVMNTVYVSPRSIEKAKFTKIPEDMWAEPSKRNRSKLSLRVIQPVAVPCSIVTLGI